MFLGRCFPVGCLSPCPHPDWDGRLMSRAARLRAVPFHYGLGDGAVLTGGPCVDRQALWLLFVVFPLWGCSQTSCAVLSLGCLAGAGLRNI